MGRMVCPAVTTTTTTSAELHQHCNRWYYWKLHADIAYVFALSADVVASNDDCFMMFHIVLSVFHDVLLVVHDVLLVVHDVSQCFTCVLWCLASRATISGATLATTQPLHRRLCRCRSPHGSRQRRRDWRWCRRDRQYRRERDPMLNSVLNGDWSNSVPGRQIPEGRGGQLLMNPQNAQIHLNIRTAVSHYPKRFVQKMYHFCYIPKSIILVLFLKGSFVLGVVMACIV